MVCAMTLPPSPEAQIDGQAAEMRRFAESGNWPSKSQIRVWLDTYEALGRENASVLQDAVDMAEALANAQGEIARLTAALADMRAKHPENACADMFPKLTAALAEARKELELARLALAKREPEPQTWSES
jgi:hypothetical protein